MRGHRSLYRLHLGLGMLAVGLVVAAAAVVVVNSDLTPPSGTEISEACQSWLSSGGPAAVLGLSIIALAIGLLVISLRSLWGQVRASKRYVAGLQLGRSIDIDGATCERIDSAQALAFCAGCLRPRIYVSEGLIETLSEKELRAVVAHERHHLRRRDPLRRVVARALADGLFFVPLLRRTSERYAVLGELAADEAAVETLQDRRPLAAALLKLSDREALPYSVTGIDAERVDQLLGDPEAGRWQLPAGSASRSALAITGLAVFALVAGIVKPGLGWPVLIAAACMALMVLGPIALVATALGLSRRALRARRSLAEGR